MPRDFKDRPTVNGSPVGLLSEAGAGISGSYSFTPSMEVERHRITDTNVDTDSYILGNIRRPYQIQDSLTFEIDDIESGTWDALPDGITINVQSQSSIVHEGSQALKVNGGPTSDNAGGAARTYSTPFNFTSVDSVKLWINIHNDPFYNNLGHPVYVKLGTSDSVYWQYTIPGGTFTNDTWQQVSLPRSGFTAVGGISSWAGITRIGLFFMSAGGAAIYYDLMEAYLKTDVDYGWSYDVDVVEVGADYFDIEVITKADGESAKDEFLDRRSPIFVDEIKRVIIPDNVTYGDSTTPKRATPFYFPGGNLVDINLHLARSTPTDNDNAQVSIETNSLGVPSGTVVATSPSTQRLPVTLTALTNFNMQNVSLVAGTYWIVVSRTGSLGSDTYTISKRALPVTSKSSYFMDNTSAWNSADDDGFNFSWSYLPDKTDFFETVDYVYSII